MNLHSALYIFSLHSQDTSPLLVINEFIGEADSMTSLSLNWNLRTQFV